MSAADARKQQLSTGNENVIYESIYSNIDFDLEPIDPESNLTHPPSIGNDVTYVNTSLKTN
jgi:hypothetical protein